MEKPIKGLKNVKLYFDGIINDKYSRFPLKICNICGQPIKRKSNILVLTEVKRLKPKNAWDQQTTSKTLFHFHLRCKRRLLKLIEDSHKNEMSKKL